MLQGNTGCLSAKTLQILFYPIGLIFNCAATLHIGLVFFMSTKFTNKPTNKIDFSFLNYMNLISSDGTNKKTQKNHDDM